MLQRHPERGQRFHGSTLVTLCHYVAPRGGGRAASTLTSSFPKGGRRVSQTKQIINIPASEAYPATRYLGDLRQVNLLQSCLLS